MGVGDRGKWVVLAVTTFGAFVANLDATIVVVALPTMLTGLGTSIVALLWSLTGYMLVSTVLLLPIGRLSDLVGRRRLFLAGFVLFALGSALCGAAPSGGALIAFRCLQGVGGALVAALGTPIITEAFPPAELGMALGLNSLAWVLGAVVGPVVGGVLVTALGWRSVFYVVVPFALGAAAVGSRVLPPSRPRAARASLDLPGVAAFTVALTLVLLVVSESAAWGWLSPRSLALEAVAAAAAAFFLGWELAVPDPLFDLRLFRAPAFAASQVVATLTSVGYFGITFLLTFYLQGGLGLTPLATGFLMIAMAAPQLVTSPLGGRLSDRVGSGGPMLAGILGVGTGVLLLGQLPFALSVPAVVLPLALVAVANGFYWPPLASFVMKAAPAGRLGAASGLFFTFRNIGFSLSLALALALAAGSLPPDLAMRIFIGVRHAATPAEAHALIASVRAAFRWFALAFALAFVAGLPVLLLSGRRRGAEAVAPTATGTGGA
jgi:EmrB/QacA subfamily drug resistance transporter